jgi:hypothetical protein
MAPRPHREQPQPESDAMTPFQRFEAAARHVFNLPKDQMEPKPYKPKTRKSKKQK